MVVDLAFAVLIFLLVAGSINWIWSSKATESEKQIYEDEMLLMAKRTLDALVRNSGEPADWKNPTVPIDDIKTIGLAKRDRILDEGKINKLLKLTEEYEHISELAGYWKFNDDPTDGTIDDSSAYRNNGTCTPGTSCPSQTTDREENENKAYLFNGTDNYVEIADKRLDFGSDGFTVSMWIKSNGTLTGSASFRLLFKAEGDLASNAGWSFYVQGSDGEGKNGRVQFSDGTNQVTSSPTAGTTFVNGEWHHFVAVVDRSSDTITIYNDGAAQTGTIDISTVSGSMNNNAVLTIGRYPIGGTEHFNGKIDEVAIFSKALTQTEVENLYQYGVVLGDYKKTKQKLLIGANDYYFKLIDPSTGEKVKNSEGQYIEIGPEPSNTRLQVTVRRPVVFSYKRPGEDKPTQHEAIAELTLFSVHGIWASIPIILTIEMDCGNGIDDDRDGLRDCEDPDCFAASNCGECINGQVEYCPQQMGVCFGAQQTCTGWAWPGCNAGTYQAHSTNYEVSESSCEDAFDNDCDGKTNCEDPDCFADLACEGCKTSTVTDFDGNPYNTVLIGEQCWMRENFRCTRNADGSSVNGTGNPFTTPPGAAPGAPPEEGLLYNWEDAMNGSTSQGAQGICPTGWHVPTDAEWHTLEYYLWDKVTGTCNSGRFGSECVPAGTELQLCSPGKFCALIAGFRIYANGSFSGRTTGAYFWSSTDYSTTSAWARAISNLDPPGTFFRFNDVKGWGLSVRCIQD